MKENVSGCFFSEHSVHNKLLSINILNAVNIHTLSNAISSNSHTPVLFPCQKQHHVIARVSLTIPNIHKLKEYK